MSRTEIRASGIQGIALVAITYVYFLIFAQFAFLKRLANLGVEGTSLKIVMAAMAIGGILFSLLLPRLKLYSSPALRLRIGLCASSAAAFFALLPLSVGVAAAVSFLIGAGMATLTVTLAANLRRWTGDGHALLKVGVGTGIGYFACNFPPLFNAPPQIQSAAAGCLCFAALFLPFRSVDASIQSSPTQQPVRFLPILAGFTALVWLDSAAFYIIQNTPALKAGMWQGSAHLWTNAVLHLAAALAGAWLLRWCKDPIMVLGGAFLALGSACLLLQSPDRFLLASLVYPIGVSLYSVALVAYPSLLASTSSVAERGRMAGRIYAFAGWTGSVLGIGMAQNLGHVPPAFVAVAGVVILLPLLLRLSFRRTRELALTAFMLLAALSLDRSLHPSGVVQLSQVDRGRQVYISEGCISCHSQYVRPNTPDEVMWGPVESIEEVHRQHPPLIGNRRQGPDLSEVGVRRSALWLKMHFYDPPEVSGSSIMPPYGFLFRDERGDDLVAYLESLHGADAQHHFAEEKYWQPSVAAEQAVSLAQGQHLYFQFCATCHGSGGATRIAWQSSFRQFPTNLVDGTFHRLPPLGGEREQMIQLAQITKFGIPGTDMPGHEYLSDPQIASISLWVLQNNARPSQRP